jgi:hypothetical protein
VLGGIDEITPCDLSHVDAMSKYTPTSVAQSAAMSGQALADLGGRSDVSMSI